eukprot:gene19732-60795_t
MSGAVITLAKQTKKEKQMDAKALRFDPEWIGKNAIVLSDINLHHRDWDKTCADSTCAGDKKVAERIVKWVADTGRKKKKKKEKRKENKEKEDEEIKGLLGPKPCNGTITADQKAQGLLQYAGLVNELAPSKKMKV